MENPGQLFENDVVAPAQYLEIFRRSNNLKPEQELMLAILTDAIECILKYLDDPVVMRAKLFNEAHDWLFGQDDGEPFSFLSVCDVLNFDPSYLRRGIKAKMDAKSVQGPLPSTEKSARLKGVGAMKMRTNGGSRSRAGA